MVNSKRLFGLGCLPARSCPRGPIIKQPIFWPVSSACNPHKKRSTVVVRYKGSVCFSPRGVESVEKSGVNILKVGPVEGGNGMTAPIQS
jgi:hypothetical protein